MDRQNSFILWFDEINKDDIPLVGGKNANLGEMYQNLTTSSNNLFPNEKIQVPYGFAVTAYSYRYFIEKNGLDFKIKQLLDGLNTQDIKQLEYIGKKIREMIVSALFPPELDSSIRDSYRELAKKLQLDVSSLDVAVRSSATAEDLPDASFAGQQESYLNIQNEHTLLEAIKKAFASLFTNRAISYRVDKNFDHFHVSLSVAVQKMARSDRGSSGVMFTIDTESGFKDTVLINGSWGLGEYVVKGIVTPDEYMVFKPTLKKGFHSIISKKLGSKEKKLIYSTEGNSQTKDVVTSLNERQNFVLKDEIILKLARWGLIIEDHYKKPMDMEWAYDSLEDQLYIVQARPETVQSKKNLTMLEEYVLEDRGKILAQGAAVGRKIGQGKAHFIKDPSQLSEFNQGEVLLAEITDPDWEPIMKKATAIVTNSGGRTCFAGSTKVLTTSGFLSLEELHERQKNNEEFSIFAYDYISKKPTWKKVLSTQKNLLPTIRASVSQRVGITDNTIDVTLDHKFYTYKGRKLLKKSLKQILAKKEAVCLVDSIPQNNSLTTSNKLAYLLGALATDGNIYLQKGIHAYRRGSITFTQKETEEKKEFIETVNSYFTNIFGKSFRSRERHISSYIGERLIVGVATDYRCYSLSIALKLWELLKDLPLLSLSFSKENALHFLAGVIDGDGTFVNNRIQIYAGKRNVIEGIIISCLRLGIFPQVTRNRTILNIQILEKMTDILKYSRRIKKQAEEKILGNKLFSAKQLFEDIADEVNYKGRIKPYITHNYLIDSRKIRKYILPLISLPLKKQVQSILDSNLRMQRIHIVQDLGEKEVFNVEVDAQNEIDHNFVVFTKRYTPLLVSNSHAAIVSRELGIPAVVGCGNATKVVPNGTDVTVSCAEGEIGKVYEGTLNFRVDKTDLSGFNLPKTEIKMIVADPELVFDYSFIPNKGVGLAREEFIISNFIKIHPNALINYDSIEDQEVKRQIDQLTVGYTNKIDYYVEKLSYGIAIIASAFYPNEVLLRFSDFKSNEYANLLGGKDFEPHEENPMIGWRGASRYYDPKFSQAFALECQAVLKVRQEMGLYNLQVMIPFCRTPEEGQKVLEEMRNNGLVHDKEKNKLSEDLLDGNLRIWVMAEIPSNILQIEDFAQIFDGFSIGSNDLTQLTLGLDRDSKLIAHIGNENNKSVHKLIHELISKAHERNLKVGICGQGPSDFPELAEFLVKEGIDSISLNPDSVLKTAIHIKDVETQVSTNI